MIVPMKKVSLVILNKDKETALKVLRKSGLVHLEKIEGTGDKLADIKNKVSKLEAAAGVLESFKAAKKGLNQVSCSNDEAFLKAERTIEIQELKKLNEREDTRPELDVMKQELQKLEQSNKYLGEMFDLVFQNSTLNQETKDSLAVLKNKMVFGVEDNLIKTLTEEKEKLEEKIAALEQVIAEATTIKEVKETRTRR